VKRADKRTITVIMVAVVLIAAIPLFILKGAEFGGSDDAGSQVVESIEKDFEPWFSPVLESMLGRELPGEVESLIFCIQTGIGVGIIAFLLGRFVERKKWEKK
jgi:cobalt/nickel transport protein